MKTILTGILQSAPAGYSDSKSQKLHSGFRRKHESGVSLVRLHLHPLDLLSRLSPLAFILCVFFAYWVGELQQVRLYSAREMSFRQCLVLSMNGFLAFALNVISFSANRRVGPLNMTVAGTS